MPSKTEEYLALAQRTANGLTRYWEHWTDYLTTASRFYRFVGRSSHFTEHHSGLFDSWRIGHSTGKGA